MARLAFFIINTFVVVTIVSVTMYSQVSAQVQESKLGTAFSATTWGAGIGIVAGLGLAALETPDTETKGETGDRVRNNVLQGFGAGVLAGLLYGLFEISDIGAQYNVSYLYDTKTKQTLVAYNHKF